MQEIEGGDLVAAAAAGETAPVDAEGGVGVGHTRDETVGSARVAVEARRGREEVGGGGGAAQKEGAGDGVGAQGADGLVSAAVDEGRPDVGAGGGELDEEPGGVGRRRAAGGERNPAGRTGFARYVDGVSR